MGESRRRKLPGACVLRVVSTLILLLAGAQARGDYKDAFKKGIDAYDRKRWDDVVKHMREAISENPAEGERIKLYGLRFEVYFPHFYLGAAYLNQGRCEEAVKAFKASEAQGAIRSSPRYAELVDGLKSCEGAAAPAPLAPPVTRPTTTTLAAPAPTPLPALPQPTPPPPTLAPPLPTPAPTPASTPTPAPIAPRRGPPVELLNGARAYFEGQYEKAVGLLAQTAGLRGRAAAQSLLLRSAARFALYRAGGEREGDLRRLAAEDAAAARRADPSLQPDGEAFSPQFIELFRASR